MEESRFKTLITQEKEVFWYIDGYYVVMVIMSKL